MSEPQRVRIVSDGTGAGTRIYGLDGTDLTHQLGASEAHVAIVGGGRVVLTGLLPGTYRITVERIG